MTEVQWTGLHLADAVAAAWCCCRSAASVWRGATDCRRRQLQLVPQQLKPSAGSLLPRLLICFCCLLPIALAAAAAGAPTPEATSVYNDSFLAGFNGPFPTISGHAGTEISSTVSLLYQFDWDVQYIGRAADDWSSKCIDMLHRANESKAKVVNFMVTHYWVDDNFDGKVGWAVLC